MNAEIQRKLEQGLKYLNYKQVRAAIKQGANVNIKVFGGEYPVNFVLLSFKRGQKKSLLVLKELIKAGVYLHKREVGQTPPILIAAQYANLDAIKILLENGANINETTLSIHDRELDFFFYASNNEDPKVKQLNKPLGKLWLRLNVKNYK